MRVKLPISDRLCFIASFIFLTISLLYGTSFQAAHADLQTPVLPMQSFSNFTCISGIGNVMLTGYFTNGETPFKVIFLKMFLLDSGWNVIATGYGNIQDVKPHEIKSFNAITRFSGNYSSCTVQIDNVIPN